MGIMEILGVAASVSLLAGWRLYLCIFATGLAMRLGWIAPPEHLQGLAVLANDWDNGKKLVKGTCRGGLMVGAWKGFFENGAVEWEATMEAGVIVGTFKSFYANDQKRAVVGFKDGASGRHGEDEEEHPRSEGHGALHSALEVAERRP